MTCNVCTQVDSIVTCDASTQTEEGNEESNKRTDGGAVEEEKEELKKTVSEMVKFFEEQDNLTRQLKATIHEGTTKKRNSVHQD